MKRVFSLFLALLIVLQSIIAVGEEQIPPIIIGAEGNDFVLDPSMPAGESGESFVGENTAPGRIFFGRERSTYRGKWRKL